MISELIAQRPGAAPWTSIPRGSLSLCRPTLRVVATFGCSWPKAWFPSLVRREPVPTGRARSADEWGAGATPRIPNVVELDTITPCIIPRTRRSSRPGFAGRLTFVRSRDRALIYEIRPLEQPLRPAARVAAGVLRRLGRNGLKRPRLLRISH